MRPRRSDVSRSELATFLKSLFHDTQADPKVGIQAFTATAMGLYQYFPRDDVDAALLAIPR